MVKANFMTQLIKGYKFKPVNPATIEFFLWLKLNIEEENKSALAHLFMIDFILTPRADKKTVFRGIECFRGASKSTLVGIYQVLWYIDLGKKPNFGDFDYILYVSDTVTQVAGTFEQILQTIEDRPLLKERIEIIRSRLGDDPTIVFRNKRLNKKFYLRGRGSGQKLRGIRMGGKRPNIVIADDIENDENVENSEVRAKLKKWFMNALLPSLNPNKSEVIFIGTPLHQDSLLVNLEHSESWDFIKVPVCNSFPISRDKFISSWGDRFDYDYVNDFYQMFKEQGNVNGFNQEYQLTVIDKGDMMFDLSQIHYYDYNVLLPNMGELEYYISVDLAISQKETAHYTSIIVVGINSNNDWVVVNGSFGRFKATQTIDKILEFVAMYRPVKTIIEKVAFQASMEHYLQREMIRLNMTFVIDMIPKTKADSKISVFKGLEPVVNTGRLWLPSNFIPDFISELVDNEMGKITQSKILAKFDDLLDSLAQLTKVSLINRVPMRGNAPSSGALVDSMGNVSFNPLMRNNNFKKEFMDSEVF